MCPVQSVNYVTGLYRTVAGGISPRKTFFSFVPSGLFFIITHLPWGLRPRLLSGALSGLKKSAGLTLHSLYTRWRLGCDVICNADDAGDFRGYPVGYLPQFIERQIRRRARYGVFAVPAADLTMRGCYPATSRASCALRGSLTRMKYDSGYR